MPLTPALRRQRPTIKTLRQAWVINKTLPQKIKGDKIPQLQTQTQEDKDSRA
jgi:hypothetical protein